MRAGFASTVITPQLGVAMAGYGTRTEGALGTHDDLQASALWLEDAETTVALVSVDLIGVDASLVWGIADRLVDVLPAGGLLLCATHTHAGPVVVRDRIGSRLDRPGADRVAPEVEARVEEAVRNARAGARAARVGFAVGEVSDLGTNRRREDGPADRSVAIIAIHGANGDPIAALVRYSCHPTVLDATNRFYSAEYPGAARREVAERTGIPILFLNGSAGDVSTRFTRRETTFDEVDRFGHILADEAARLLADVRIEDSGPLSLATCRISLPTRPLPALAKAEQAVEEADRRFGNLRASGARPSAVRVAETDLFGARRTLNLVREGMPGEVEAILTALQIGGLTLVTLPGEPFTEVAVEIVRRAGSPLVVIGYANGYLGYLPTPGTQDGYEVGASLLSPDAIETLITSAAELARDVRQQVAVQ